MFVSLNHEDSGFSMMEKLKIQGIPVCLANGCWVLESRLVVGYWFDRSNSKSLFSKHIGKIIRFLRKKTSRICLIYSVKLCVGRK